ncbi:hypothetical protein OHB41_47550 [Streptomyces sp. NBC_01571]|uniref:hypothetical protein n=1 Tax=Streptomyces sp. NBC_01571 TaxID=2975883 RepID=UPI00224E2567|nr:hypothetical protein [Streptomyces sp. NBC_01571]MCX4580653.1 hypothetical protein [Streptomyces sp. NBC_01571]
MREAALAMRQQVYAAASLIEIVVPQRVAAAARQQRRTRSVQSTPSSGRRSSPLWTADDKTFLAKTIDPTTSLT